MKLTQHPLSAAFPSMSEADFLALKDDIDDKGQREPIIIFEDMVLDGWHRYRACTEIGLTPTKFNFPEGEDPVAFVLSHNLHRRHLTGSQRAAAVVACANWAPSGKPANRTPSVHLATNKEMAKSANVSPSTIKDAKAAHTAGLSDAVKDGAVTAKEAANIARGTANKPTPSKPAHVEPAPPAPTDDGPDAAELAANDQAVKADMEAIQKILDADDKLAAAYTEIKRLNAELAMVKVARDGWMNQANDSVKRIKALQRKLDQAAA